MFGKIFDNLWDVIERTAKRRAENWAERMDRKLNKWEAQIAGASDKKVRKLQKKIDKAARKKARRKK